MIYLDHNSTTPVDRRVLERMLPYFTEVYANAASTDHDPGHEAKNAVEHARSQIAALIGATPEEIIFTSGATESDNLAILGVAEKYRARGNHIITVQTEHKAVLDTCKHLEQSGYEITYLPVDNVGMVQLADLEQAVTDHTILVSVMYANNEIGTIAPIRQIGAFTRSKGIVFHTDATQAVGHIPIDVDADNIDLLSMSAHKMYGPKGVGALFTRRRTPRVRVAAQMHGGGHEKGLRSGTLNVPGIVGFGAAAELCRDTLSHDAERYREYSTGMLRILRAELGEILLNGHPTNRLPNNLNISIPRVESKSLIVQLKNIAVSTGSACTSASVEPSHVILALGYGEDRAHSAIRIGWGRNNTPADVEDAAGVLVEAVTRVRKLNV